MTHIVIIAFSVIDIDLCLFISFRDSDKKNSAEKVLVLFVVYRLFLDNFAHPLFRVLDLTSLFQKDFVATKRIR